MQKRVSNTVDGAIASLQFSNAITREEASRYLTQLQHHLALVLDELAARFCLRANGDRVHFELPVQRLVRTSPHIEGSHRDRELYVVVSSSTGGTSVSEPMTRTAADAEKMLRDSVSEGWSDLFTLPDAVALGLIPAE